MAVEGPAVEMASAIWEHSSAGVLAVDAEGRLAFTNPAACRILGLRETRPGTGVERALVRQPRLAELLRETLAGRPPVARAELAVAGAEGSALTLGFSISPIPDAGEGLLGAALVFRDLAPIEREGERERMSQRLAALGGMAAGLAHELRTPLAGMEVAAGLLQRRLSSDEEALELVGDLRVGLRRLAETVTSSLDFLRPLSLRRECADPRELLDEALENALRRAPAPVGVQRCYAEAPPAVAVDRSLFGMALVNLLTNACEAMAAGPRAAQLELSIAVLEVPEPLPTACHEVCFAIADNGPGVPRDRRDRIFDPFYSTRPAGSGIGLATVQKVVVGHGGSLSFDSDSGGSCFRVHLPLAKPAPGQGA